MGNRPWHFTTGDFGPERHCSPPAVEGFDGPVPWSGCPGVWTGKVIPRLSPLGAVFFAAPAFPSRSRVCGCRPACQSAFPFTDGELDLHPCSSSRTGNGGDARPYCPGQEELPGSRNGGGGVSLLGRGLWTLPWEYSSMWALWSQTSSLPPAPKASGNLAASLSEAFTSVPCRINARLEGVEDV